MLGRSHVQPSNSKNNALRTATYRWFNYSANGNTGKELTRGYTRDFDYDARDMMRAVRYTARGWTGNEIEYYGLTERTYFLAMPLANGMVLAGCPGCPSFSKPVVWSKFADFRVEKTGSARTQSEPR